MMNEGPATESGPAEIALMWKTVPPRMPSPISAWAKAEAASRLRNPHPHPCGGRTLPENRQRSPVDALRQAWQDGAAMDESEKQFSFSRAALQSVVCNLVIAQGGTHRMLSSHIRALIPVVGLLAAISVCAADAPARASQAAERKPAVWMIPPAWPDGRCLRELFDKPDGWKDTRSKITGIGFWATHFDEFFSDKDLRAWFADIREWKLKLGLEVRVIRSEESRVGKECRYRW